MNNFLKKPWVKIINWSIFIYILVSGIYGFYILATINWGNVYELRSGFPLYYMEETSSAGFVYSGNTPVNYWESAGTFLFWIGLFYLILLFCKKLKNKNWFVGGFLLSLVLTTHLLFLEPAGYGGPWYLEFLEMTLLLPLGFVFMGLADTKKSLLIFLLAGFIYALFLGLIGALIGFLIGKIKSRKSVKN